MPYELDSTADADGEQADANDGAGARNDDARDGDTPTGDARGGGPRDSGPRDGDDAGERSNASLDESLGVSIPDEHVGAFVAEAFEDPERSTSWAEAVDAMVAPDVRGAWDDLSPRERAAEVLSKAAAYDRRAVDRLDGVPLDPDREAVPDAVREALRCRRNADAFRDAVADAYGEGRLDDDDLVAAVDAADFETATIARREDLLERVTEAYDVDFRPYGGTLMDADDGPDPDVDHGAREAW